jgi:hypothetical protein
MPFKFQAGVTHIHPFENGIVMSKEYSLSVSVSSGRKIHFKENKPVQLN